MVPESLGNDNWHGYLQPWIYEVGGARGWKKRLRRHTGRVPHCSQSRSKARRRSTGIFCMTRCTKRTHEWLSKVRCSQPPFDWNHMHEQLQRMEQEESIISLPHSGEVLATMVKLQMHSGLVSLNKHIKHVTVRRNNVVQLIRMFRDSGHPDYQHSCMDGVARKAKLLADTDEPSVPNGLADILESESETEKAPQPVDKAATPAKRLFNVPDLLREMDRARPNILSTQGGSDALKEIEASRASAFSRFSVLELRTGSKLVDQFQGSYTPRVFNLTLPRMVGGPDLRGRERFRRHSEDALALSLQASTRMSPRRVEAQIRWDWGLVPSVWSLNFATQVNTGASLAIPRTLRTGAGEETQEREIALATASAYRLLWEGEYVRKDGKRQRVGDTAKIVDAIGLTATQCALFRNYRLMSSRILGTRQVRRSINHHVFSSRITYGLPICMTITPSERHSALMVRLSRYRRSDLAILVANPDFARWSSYNSPSVQSCETPAGDAEQEYFEVPSYDLRKLMIARDSVCSVDVSNVTVRIVMAQLFGIRMCPDCPQLCSLRVSVHGHIRQ